MTIHCIQSTGLFIRFKSKVFYLIITSKKIMLFDVLYKSKGIKFSFKGKIIDVSILVPKWYYIKLATPTKYF